MNLACLACGGTFDEFNWVTCDGCERLSHREPCGQYELIEHLPTGVKNAYFFCQECLREDEDDAWNR